MGHFEKADLKAGSDSPPRLSDDQFYRALCSTQRRRLLYYLLDEEASSVGTIATVLTGWDTTETGAVMAPEDRRRHLIALKHNHLPRLAEADLIAYDPQNETVSIESLDPFVREIIRRSVESERS